MAIGIGRRQILTAPGGPQRTLAALGAVMIGLVVNGCPVSAATTEQPPQDGCVAVAKLQYDSAKKQYLLTNRFGMYVRTGPPFRRRYWYCH
jgi:hypothetical protein